MLDIKFIRENQDLIKEAARKKRINFNVEKLIEVDDRRRNLLSAVESKRSAQNEASEKIAGSTSAEERNEYIKAMKSVKADMEKEEEELKTVAKEWQTLMVSVPNIPDISVPEGESDNDNKEIRAWGSITKFGFEPKDHIEIMKGLDMVDLERGAKVAGFRGYFLKNDGVLLSLAIWNYAFNYFLNKGFSPMIVPSLVRRENLLGTSYLPQGEEDLYKTQDGDYLAGTAEVATMGYYMNEILDKKDLPKKIISFSPCFRREAGSHGKDIKGLIRVHEFYKLEQVILSEASHEESVKFHEWINNNTEEFIKSLGLPHRTIINCGADLGLGQVKKYDIELWVPLEKKYREISSASYFHDFQTRRLNIRYRDESGKLHYAHSLNSTAIPTPRILVSLVENFQQADGTIKVPEVLIPYLNGRNILGKP